MNSLQHHTLGLPLLLPTHYFTYPLLFHSLPTSSTSPSSLLTPHPPYREIPQEHKETRCSNPRKLAVHNATLQRLRRDWCCRLQLFPDLTPEHLHDKIRGKHSMSTPWHHGCHEFRRSLHATAAHFATPVLYSPPSS